MPNDNISFNSIDELQHFRTSEEPYLAAQPPAFPDGRMMDSGHFLTEPAKREADDVFGMPVIAPSGAGSRAEGGVDGVETSGFDGEHVIGSIPIVSPSSVTDYTDLVHLNVEHNPSSFAVVPVGKAERGNHHDRLFARRPRSASCGRILMTCCARLHPRRSISCFSAGTAESFSRCRKAVF